VAGCIIECDDRILLCRRAIEPRHGLWTVPAGFMENDETLEQAALRETREEACAEPVLSGLYGVYNIPYVSQIYVIFRARLEAPVFSPGAESLEVELFSEDQVPWDELAFRVVHATLERYYRDRGQGDFPIHIDEIRR
jgi:ADP-ribose pyrophosphatase YjhB (NUDIX family)